MPTLSLIDGTRALQGAAESGPKTLSVSVVIITSGRISHLKQCLASLEACSAPRPLEVLVVLNGKDFETRRWLESGAAPKGVRWLESMPASKGRARNRGALAARGEYVLFLDDDVTVPAGLFGVLERYAAPAALDVLGGPNLTPPDSSPFQRAAGFLLESWWGSGSMRARYKALARRGRVDDRSFMLCNLLVRRAFFEGGRAAFPTDFFYNEENVLLERLRRQRAVMRYAPEMAVYHARRNGWRPFLTQVWRSGVGRGHMTRAMPGTCRPIFGMPLAFLAYVWALPFLPAGWLWAPCILYGAATAAEALRFAWTDRSLSGGFRVAGLMAGAHALYGLGFLAGLVRPSLNAPSEPA